MSSFNLPFNLGIHPINWVGEDVLEHGEFYTYEQVMEEISSLLFKGTEISRKFPEDPVELQKALTRYGLQLTTQWKSVFFSDPNRHESELRAYRKHVEFLKKFGCKVVSTAEIGGSMLNQDPRRGQDETDVQRLDDDGWKYMVEGLNKAGEICRENGMHLVYHHHAGTVVEQPEEIDRLMEMSDPHLVSLLYDTGHGYYGGNDPVQLLEKYYDRVKYVHLKDVRQEVLDKAREEKYSIRQCIRSGLFTVPGDGCLDFSGVFNILIEKGYKDWALIEGEQDPLICNPYEYAKKSKQYIGELIQQIQKNNLEGVK
ncbi:myo-inosose-2 dehydratase [Bacillus sp. FJAT-50079]|uniref:myo-inosose-2 dehydratase n=1 Tax=Bacillus sp. FJAT-50079 TaxID=2833577 RepID=UPI001BC8FB5C|nr:myo-inosose-2 dehydratase [Bacillus sp. FJAT-50079]MBS4208874.1 myo-inosose-2 dehydratase [Bacillus sp. FJAT-50079]